MTFLVVNAFKSKREAPGVEIYGEFVDFAGLRLWLFVACAFPLGQGIQKHTRSATDRVSRHVERMIDLWRPNELEYGWVNSFA